MQNLAHSEIHQEPGKSSCTCTIGLGHGNHDRYGVGRTQTDMRTLMEQRRTCHHAHLVCGANVICARRAAEKSELSWLSGGLVSRRCKGFEKQPGLTTTVKKVMLPQPYLWPLSTTWSIYVIQAHFEDPVIGNSKLVQRAACQTSQVGLVDL